MNLTVQDSSQRSFSIFIALLTQRFAYMKFYLLLFTVLFITSIPAFSQDKKIDENKEAAYTQTINNRADKIVSTLGITDQDKALRVKNLIAGQYRNLS